MNKVIQVCGLTIAHAQGHAVLQNITPSLAAGETLVLVGSSRAGKSSLRRALLGDLASEHRFIASRSPVAVARYCKPLRARSSNSSGIAPRGLGKIRLRRCHPA